MKKIKMKWRKIIIGEDGEKKKIKKIGELIEREIEKKIEDKNIVGKIKERKRKGKNIGKGCGRINW